MAKEKDELISQAELARRLNVKPPYIAKNKDKLKNAKCMFGKKYYFRKSSLLLGKNPDDPHESYQSKIQTSPKKDESKSTENWNAYTNDDAKKKINEVLEDLKPKETTKKPQPKKPVPQKKDNVPRGTIENDELELLREENQKLKNELNILKSKDTFDDLKANIKKLYVELSKVIGDSDSTFNKAQLDGLKAKAVALKELELAVHQGIKNKQLEDDLFDKESVLRILGFAISTIRNALLNLSNNYAVALEGLEQKEIKDYVSEDINKILSDLQLVSNQFE